MRRRLRPEATLATIAATAIVAAGLAATARADAPPFDRGPMTSSANDRASNADRARFERARSLVGKTCELDHDTRLHDEPHVLAAVAVMLEEGEILQVLDARDGWLRVRTEDGTVGWLSASHVTILTTHGGFETTRHDEPRTTREIRREEGAFAMARDIRTADAGLQIWRVPNKNGGVLTSMPAGTEFVIVNDDPGTDFAQVRTRSGYSGWVYEYDLR